MEKVAREHGEPTHLMFCPSRIPPEAMETIADVLLASSRRSDDCPAYSEEQISRKRRRASRAEEYFAVLTAARHALQRPAQSVPEYVKMPEDERTTWEMFAAGYRASEIARLLGTSRPTAVRLLRAAARRIAACESAFCGLRDVYHTEVHRRVYRKPRHCAEQPCRRLGYCKYAVWA